MTTSHRSYTVTKTYGDRPVGNCAPDGRTLWATRSASVDGWEFTSYDGWLITSETSTTDGDIAEAIDRLYTERFEGMTFRDGRSCTRCLPFTVVGNDIWEAHQAAHDSIGGTP